MIGIIGKICSGKTTFIKNLEKLGYKIFIADDFYAQNYKKNGIFYEVINTHIGDFLNDENGINKDKLKTWICENNYNLDLLEKLTYPLLFDHLKNNSFDFAELPKIVSKNFDFSPLFSMILCLDLSNKKWQKNSNFRNVDNFTKNALMQKNNPFLTKNALFGKIPIVNIYEYNQNNTEIIRVFLMLANLNV